MGVTEFRESILKSLIQKSEISQISQGENYKLVTCKRGRCCECYNEMVKQGGRQHAQKVTRKVRGKEKRVVKTAQDPANAYKISKPGLNQKPENRKVWTTHGKLIR
ncbi:hypothetical protein QTP88_010172 [Uroleucon formosanum]